LDITGVLLIRAVQQLVALAAGAAQYSAILPTPPRSA
jgi:hypothetical protein